MEKILFTILFALTTVFGYAQDRENTAPSQLTHKSKEIKKALYWSKNSKGQWDSRKNNHLIYLGEGIHVDNFNSIFIGEYAQNRYLFIDYKNYYWRYPNLKVEWMVCNRIEMILLTENDYNAMRNLRVGETLTIASRYYNGMNKSHSEYSFPFFLELTETLISSTQTVYKSYLEPNGDNRRAELYLKSEHPEKKFITFKRVQTSDGKDVVRFCVYPHGSELLINSHYFEVDYSTYCFLFEADRKNIHK